MNMVHTKPFYTKEALKQKEHITRQIHSDAKKRRSFVAMLFVAGDLQR